MMHRQSAVVSTTRDEVIEQASGIPRDIQPALIGSGKIAMSLDTLGMQGHNICIHQYRDTMTMDGAGCLDTYHLHIYHDQAISEHYYRGVPRFENMTPAWFSHLPFGYLEYCLIIDGKRYETEDILRLGHTWQRRFNPREGIVRTSYIIDDVRITWQAGSRLKHSDVDFVFSSESINDQSRTVELIVRHVLKLRDGRPVATDGLETIKANHGIARLWTADTNTSSAPLHVPLYTGWALCSQAEDTAYSHDEFSLELRWQSFGKNTSTQFRFALAIDHDNPLSSEHLLDQAIGLPDSSIDFSLTEVKTSWVDYFSQAADIQWGDARSEFLYAMSQYVLRAGVPWRTGAPLGNLWSRKFGAMTFWDTFYAADGMLRAGHVDEVRQFAHWLNETRQPEGRPHYWMTWYDGTPGTFPENDKAYINCLAYAGILIRYAQYVQDIDSIRELVYPYLKQISSYLLENALRRDEFGWHMTGEVAGDIGVENDQASEQSDVLLWVVLTVAKYAEYAELLGDETGLIDQANDLRKWFKSNPIVPRANTIWYAWLPFLAPAGPYVDFSKWFDDSVDSYELLLIVPTPLAEVNQLYEVERGKPYGRYPFGSYQGMPWSHGCTAASCLLTGQHDLAREFYEGIFS